MRRRSFDKIMSVTGLVLAIVLGIGGALLMWGGTFAHNTVTTELSAQKIAFDDKGEELPPALQQYAGMAVTDGPMAAAYADLIGEHLLGVADGKTYSQVSGEWMAGGMKDQTLAQQRTTLFMGETLRGLLLNAYAFWTFGTIAIIGAWVMWGAAAVLLVLAILGFVHLSKTDETAAVFEPAHETASV